MSNINKSLNNKVKTQIFYFIGCFGFAFKAHALVLLQSASTATSVNYDNNVGMSKNPQSIWRYSLVPNYRAEFNDNLNRWFANGSLNIQRSSDRNLSIDREDPTVAVGWSHELARGSFSLNGNYRRSSTRFTELDDSGLISRDATSVAKSISANWSRYLTERLSWSLGGGYSQSSFKGSGDFTGFTSKSLNTSLNYEWSERIRPFINLGYTTYSPDGANQVARESQTYTSGASYNINDRLTSSFSAGITRLNTGVGKVGSISLSYLGDNYQLTSAYSRSVTPSSIGGFQNADSIALSYGYELSNKSNLGANFSWRKNNSLNDLESKQMSAFYARNLSEYWQMRLSVQMREIKSTNQTVNGEVIGISLIYNTLEF